MKKIILLLQLFATLCAAAQEKPNVIIIYADDLGFGDLSTYGGSIKTPHIDSLANSGIKFTNAYATDATCTPSRFSLLTGTYSWRKPGRHIADGDAALIIDPATKTLADVFQSAGYHTGIVGKWHLGLGGKGGPDWNGTLAPGPLELGFDEAYIMAATQDRVPTVYIKNHLVENLDPADPISVDYRHPIAEANLPTYNGAPDQIELKSSPHQGHDNTLINGIGRIGYMSGGRRALWDDYAMGQHFADKAMEFIANNSKKPFFLYYATPNIHVPRTPSAKFAGKSGKGSRGDSILEFDDHVGQIVAVLRKYGILRNTIIIISSDNGPVLDDGYQDRAEELLGNHEPSGGLSGGKYSIFEGGTRVPMIVYYPKKIKKGKTSSALMSQVDITATMAELLNVSLRNSEASDSFRMLRQLLGKSNKNRPFVIENAGGIAIIKNGWKYIEPNAKPAYNALTKIQLGNSQDPQLYDLTADPLEKNNLAKQYLEKVKELKAQLDGEISKNITN